MSFKLFKAIKRALEEDLTATPFVEGFLLEAFHRNGMPKELFAEVGRREVRDLTGPGFSSINFVNSTGKKIPLKINVVEKPERTSAFMRLGRYVLMLDRHDAMLVARHAEKNVGIQSTAGQRMDVLFPEHILRGWNPAVREDGKVADVKISDSVWEQLARFPRLAEFKHRVVFAFRHAAGELSQQGYFSTVGFRRAASATEYFFAHKNLLEQLSTAKDHETATRMLSDHFSLDTSITGYYGREVFSAFEKHRKAGFQPERFIEKFQVTLKRREE